MPYSVPHQARVAWDGARTVVAFAVSDVDTYSWFRERLVGALGGGVRANLHDTRERLTARPEDAPTEAARWRAHLEDVQLADPLLTEDLWLLVCGARPRLRGTAPAVS
jgi:hypothetical protein